MGTYAEMSSFFGVSSGGRQTANMIFVTEFSELGAIYFANRLFQISSKDPDKQIIIVINSFGGDVYALLAMLDVMQSVPNQILTVGNGKAMSCGAILLACGDIRFATENTTIMLHEVSGASYGNVHDVSTDTNELVRLNELVADLFVKHSKFKGGVEAYKALFTGTKRDIYLTTKQAKKLRIIDNIGFPRVIEGIQYQIYNGTPKRTFEEPPPPTKKKKPEEEAANE